MEKIIHKADSRGLTDFGWLKARPSFSFGNYYDPSKIHFGALRVLNDDIIAGGEGFGMHPHDNMEIITIPIKGALEHKDSTGSHGVIEAGDVQIMSAGSGITHSEFNHSETQAANTLQIWVFPKEKNIKPRYDQKRFGEDTMKDKFLTVVSPEEGEGLWINQDAYFSLGKFENETETEYKLRNSGSGVYAFIIEGGMEVDGEKLSDRDAIGISGTDSIKFKINAGSKLLLMEVPMRLN